MISDRPKTSHLYIVACSFRRTKDVISVRCGVWFQTDQRRHLCTLWRVVSDRPKTSPLYIMACSFRQTKDVTSVHCDVWFQTDQRRHLCTLWRVVSDDTQTQRCGNCGGVPNPEHAWVHQPPDQVGRPATQPPGPAPPSCGRRPVQQKQRGQTVLFGQSGQYTRR